MKPQKQEKNKGSERAPIVVIAGHIDHGKSTLLDYIRKTNTTKKEAGGITQHINAYEVVHKDSAGKEHKITFLDTPGHAAFCGIRERGVAAADIAVLVISAEDGVKTQTLEALNCIKNSGIPYIIAINKIDKTKDGAEKTKQNLAENEIYVEGYGGDIPCVAISALTGQNVGELLDMITLVAELHEIKGDRTKSAEGIIVESFVDPKRGIEATTVIKNGVLKIGNFMVAGDAWCPVRNIENFAGEKIEEAVCGQPVGIVGWSKTPAAGSLFKIVKSKKEAEKEVSSFSAGKQEQNHTEQNDENSKVISLIVKADTAGSVEAILNEIRKIKTEGIILKVIDSGIGTINEGDVKLVGTATLPIVIGFNVKADSRAKSVALRNKIPVEIFDIIYRLTEFLSQEAEKHRPAKETEQTEGSAKILKIFGSNKGKYIVGGRVEKGILKTGDQIKLLRREKEIGRGKIKNLQQQKAKVEEVKTGVEFGAMVETSAEPVPQDSIESYTVTRDK